MLPLAALAFASYVAFHRTVLKIFEKKGSPKRVKFAFRSAVAVAGIIGLHGFNSIKIFATLAVNYVIGRHFGGTKYAQAATWSFALLALFLLEWGNWQWSAFSSYLEFMDDWSGLVRRWDVTFNIAVLRLISFNVDWHQAKCPETVMAASKHQNGCEACKEGDCEKFRSISPLDIDKDYNPFSYCSYILYLPLFIAGPIVSFNNFMSQTERPTPRINWKYISQYGARLIGTILAFELFLHMMWVVAIKDTESWKGFTPLQFAALGMMNLFVVWFKLVIIWRFFRLIALLDGIESPENMERCICNNYSGFGFWRGWHRSFNLWIIRYMYIPMGGTRTAAWNVFPIFTFVALWHDFEWRMLVWGWLIALFLIPELVVTWYAKRIHLVAHPYYRHICAVAGGLNLLQVTICNLLGFAIGIDGTKEMMRRMFTLSQIPFVIGLLLFYFANVQVAFEVREEEKRRGIYRNY